MSENISTLIEIRIWTKNPLSLTLFGKEGKRKGKLVTFLPNAIYFQPIKFWSIAELYSVRTGDEEFNTLQLEARVKLNRY
jgi:hypothetical protein